MTGARSTEDGQVQERDVPEEITLTADTMARLMADPELAAGVDRARDTSRAAMIDYLDHHGLRWRAGGSDPTAALGDALTIGGFDELDAFEFEPFQASAGPSPDQRAQTRRKAARKSAKKARRSNRRS